MACAASGFPCRFLGAAGRTFCRHHFATVLGTQENSMRSRLLCYREPSRWLASSSDTSVSSDAAAEAPTVSGEKPPQPSPAALKRLLKISLPGASRVSAKDTNASAAEPPHAIAVSAVSSEARETPQETAAPQQQQQQQAAAQSDVWREGENGTGEFGFKYKGPEPTKHGDWAHKGRVTDF